MAQQSKLTTGGQITVPAHVRKRWNTERVTVEDHDDHLIVRPVPEDIAARIAALRGVWKPAKPVDFERALRQLDEEESEIEERKRGGEGWRER